MLITNLRDFKKEIKHRKVRMQVAEAVWVTITHKEAKYAVNRMLDKKYRVRTDTETVYDVCYVDCDKH